MLVKNEDLSKCVGLTVDSISGLSYDSEAVIIAFKCGSTLTMKHLQECCETVSLEDWGDALESDFVGETISTAEEVTKDSDQGYGCSMWTFYKISFRDMVDLYLRWNGTSNGYYSVGVTCTFEPAPEAESKPEFKSKFFGVEPRVDFKRMNIREQWKKITDN